MKSKKMRRPVKRNPMAAELARNTLFRTKVMASAEEMSQKEDPWDRSAKHKSAIVNDLNDDDDWGWCDDYE